MSGLRIDEIRGGVEFTAKIVPGSSRTAIAGLLGEMLKVKVAAAPEKGKANECLIEFLADKLGIRKCDITIISGTTSPVKQIRILGVSVEQAKKLTG